MNPPDDRLIQTLEDLKKGGWFVAVLGALGAFLRLLLSKDAPKATEWVRRILAGAVMGLLCYFAIHGLIDPVYEAIAYSVSGAVSNELVKILTNKVKRA
jgi:uncharacterized membrane protein